MNDLAKGAVLFRKGYYAKNRERFAALAGGQSPHSLFIACADSRVVPSLITGSGPGELFVIRNIANMVPPWEQAEKFLAVSSAIEYAVAVLKVANIIVCGHSNCGGCRLLMDGGADSLPLASAWVDISSAVRREQAGRPETDHIEQDNVLHQLERLNEYPIIAERYNDGSLSLWGWYYCIESGEIHQYNSETQRFELIT